jgi:hypothetical protein
MSTVVRHYGLRPSKRAVPLVARGGELLALERCQNRPHPGRDNMLSSVLFAGQRTMRPRLQEIR